MRFLSADFIFPITSASIPNGILVVNDDERIVEILTKEVDNVPDSSKIERFEGILCPGFVNAHCHLELSHMKNVVEEKTGLPKFLMEIVTKRDANSEKKQQAIEQADQEMWLNGIQAVGDICNTTDTIATKLKSRIAYHSFVEVFSFNSSKAHEVLKRGMEVTAEYRTHDMKATVVPHAPYSVSKTLFAGIREAQSQLPGPVSMHNQETEGEDDMFVNASGDLIELFKRFGEDFSDFHPEYSSSLDYSLSQLPATKTAMLVHNTLTSSEQMRAANEQHGQLFWCSCPRANLYIENRLPNIPMWLENGARVCVGTDSLASNHSLSILEELKAIQSSFPHIGIDQLLQMACIQGARALHMDGTLGSFENEKAPGVVLIQNLDETGIRLTSKSEVKRIM